MDGLAQVYMGTMGIRPVAIKCLQPEVVQHASSLQDFWSEIQQLRALLDPNIVQMYGAAITSQVALLPIFHIVRTTKRLHWLYRARRQPILELHNSGECHRQKTFSCSA